MLVKELIERLEAFNQDLPVMYIDEDVSFMSCPVHSVVLEDFCYVWKDPKLENTYYIKAVVLSNEQEEESLPK